MKSIIKQEPLAQFSGIGGEKMIACGLKNTIVDINQIAVMGFFEVVTRLFFFRNLFSQVLDKIEFINPTQIILIDYPGFNLRLAKKIKKRFKIPITYYISPQLWAWKENRNNIIKKYIDQMLVIFPFEEAWYKQRGVEAKFVGHPIFDEWTISHKNDLCNKLHINPNQPIITLYPGSRIQELKYHLPLFIKCAKKLKMLNNDIQFILGLAPNMEIKNFSIPEWIQIEKKFSQISLECADLAIVCSGSSTLEATIFGTPHIVVYKMSFISWWISWILVKTKYIAMVNIISQEMVVPEYLQHKANVKNIFNKANEILNDTEKLVNMKKKLFIVKEALKGTGASERAAKFILELSIKK